MSGVNFEIMSVRTEVVRRYAVTGAPIMEAEIGFRGQVRKYSPASARFTFVDGECEELVINAYPVCIDGSVSESTRPVPNVNSQDRSNWPMWLHDLYKLAFVDLRYDSKVSV